MTTPLASRCSAIAEGIWTLEGSRVRMLGIPFETRMTVIQLASGGLWLHSPVEADAPRMAAVRELGPVQHIVAPNRLHHLFVGQWKQQFPSACTWAEAALYDRAGVGPFDERLPEAAPAIWRDDIDQLRFEGSAILPEMVFFHLRSRSLIVTDIIQNHDPSSDGWFWRTVKRLNGIGAPHGGAPRDWRMSVRDRKTASERRDALLEWDFVRVIIAHGICIDADARQFVERAFRWLDR